MVIPHGNLQFTISFTIDGFLEFFPMRAIFSASRSHFLGIPNLYPYPGLGNRTMFGHTSKRLDKSLYPTHSRVFWELRSGNVWLNNVFMCWIFCLNLELKSEGKMKNKSATHAQHLAYPTEQDIKYRPFFPKVWVCFEKLSSQHSMLRVEYIK